jgi:hypothetical protein
MVNERALTRERGRQSEKLLEAPTRAAQSPLAH